jgi:DNA-binding IclR family transcriptional regulator
VLDAVAAECARSGGPVHYSSLAEPLGISPWTAYDLLRELEREGLVAAAYAHRTGVSVGRTQVAFLPTVAGRAALGAAPADPAEERALRRARERFASLGLTALRTSRNLDIAGHLGFWLHQAEGLPGRTRAGLGHLLGTAPEAATALSMFVAAVYGAIAPTRSGEQADALVAEVSAFQSRLARTTSVRKERLVRGLARLLEARAVAIAPPAPETA